MTKIFSFFLAALLILSTSSFAQSPPQVPDFLSPDWELTDTIKTPSAPGLVEMSRFYRDSSQDNVVVLFSVVYESEQNREEDVFMLFAKSTDLDPWVALKVDGKWYVSKDQKLDNLNFSGIFDQNNNQVGVRVALDTAEGLKEREVMFPK